MSADKVDLDEILGSNEEAENNEDVDKMVKEVTHTGDQEPTMSLDDALGTYAKPESMEEDEETIVKEVEKTTNELTPQQQEVVDKVKNQINLRDTNSISTYGFESQKSLASFADTVLDKVKVKDSGATGDQIQALVSMMREADEDMSDKNFLERLFSRGKNKLEDIMNQYQSISTQIDKIEAQLISERDDLMKDNAVLDNLYQQNLEYFRSIQIYIKAGEQKIEEINENMPAWLKEAEQRDAAQGGSMYMQGVKDIQDSVTRFEKRLADLKTTKTVAIQQAPQIRMLQNSNNLLIDKINSTTTNTIALWKGQIIIALGLANQESALEAQRATSDYTNELLRKNAEKLQQSTIDVAKASEETIIDVETLKEVNTRLIDTLNETLQISQDGRKRRKEAEVELQQIEGELAEALKNSARGDVTEVTRRNVDAEEFDNDPI